MRDKYAKARKGNTFSQDSICLSSGKLCSPLIWKTDFLESWKHAPWYCNHWSSTVIKLYLHSHFSMAAWNKSISFCEIKKRILLCYLSVALKTQTAWIKMYLVYHMKPQRKVFKPVFLLIIARSRQLFWLQTKDWLSLSGDNLRWLQYGIPGHVVIQKKCNE